MAAFHPNFRHSTVDSISPKADMSAKPTIRINVPCRTRPNCGHWPFGYRARFALVSRGRRLLRVKLMSRWSAGLSCGALAFFIAGIFSCLGGYPSMGLAFIFLAPIFMFSAMALALFSLLSARCPECGGRFFSVTFPVWPFENACNRCDAAPNQT